MASFDDDDFRYIITVRNLHLNLLQFLFFICFVLLFSLSPSFLFSVSDGPNPPVALRVLISLACLLMSPSAVVDLAKALVPQAPSTSCFSAIRSGRMQAISPFR